MPRTHNQRTTDWPFTRKTRTISIRVSEQEYERLVEAAMIEDVSSVSDYVRSALFCDPASPTPVGMTLKDLVHLVDDLRRQLRTIRKDICQWAPRDQRIEQLRRSIAVETDPG